MCSDRVCSVLSAFTCVNAVLMFNGTALERVLKSKLFWLGVAFFATTTAATEAWALAGGLGVTGARRASEAGQVNAVLSYPTLMVGTLYSFMLGFFTTILAVFSFLAQLGCRAAL